MAHFSLTSRLSLLFTLAVCGVLVASGFVFDQFSQRHFDRFDQYVLEEKLNGAETLLLGLGDLHQLQVVQPELQSLMGGHRDLSALIFDADGRVLFSEPEQVAIPLNYPQWQRRGTAEWSHNAKTWRGLQRQITRDGQQLNVLLMLDVTEHRAFLRSLSGWLWAALLLVIPGSVLLGWTIASRGLRPVHELSQTAISASAQSPVVCLSTQQIPAELLPLALAFNAVLARQARIIDDIPAKANPDSILSHREPVELRELCASVLDFYEVPAKGRGIHFELDGTGMLQGDALMLRQALSNLLANTLRDTPDGATISLEIAQDEHCLFLTLANPGISLQPEPRQPVSEPGGCVYHVRGVDRGGAFTHSIIEAHQGSISYSTVNGEKSLALVFRI
ncbi:ATP-binding protein [Pseudomonas sp. B392_1p]|uniref:ATP-binding protein n=1 Tax=Pseudomonas sp. B392_1p TaxID=3457507 RepID=UPI003FD59E7A